LAAGAQVSADWTSLVEFQNDPSTNVDLMCWLQLGSFLLSLSPVLGVLVTVIQYGAMFLSFLVSPNFTIGVILLAVGVLVDLGCIIYGGLLLLSSLGLSNYLYFGISKPFLGEDIKDEIGLSISY
jgi:uncharacterized membrane protein